MQILNGVEQFKNFINQTDCRSGCLSDTGFLYGVSYTDDRVYKQALEVFLFLEEHHIPVHANVVTRMEFIDLIFRKQLTLGAISLFQNMDSKTFYKSLYNFLKKIRDDDTVSKKNKNSFKIGDRQLKQLREKLKETLGIAGWQNFCENYTDQMLLNEWEILEEELGLHFIEIMEGQTSPLIPLPLKWKDMVKTVGQLGIRAPDAMTINLFKACSLNLLITADKDFEIPENDEPNLKDKAILILH